MMHVESCQKDNKFFRDKEKKVIMFQRYGDMLIRIILWPALSEERRKKFFADRPQEVENQRSEEPG